MPDQRPNPEFANTAGAMPSGRRALFAAGAVAALIVAVWAISLVYDNFAKHSEFLANLVLSLLGIGVVAALWIALRMPGKPAPPSVVRMEPVDLRLPAADPEAVLRAVRGRLAFGAAVVAVTGSALGSRNRGVDGDPAGLTPPPQAGPGLRLAWVHLLWEAGKRKEALDLLRQAAAGGSEADARRAEALRQLMELEWAARRRTEGNPAAPTEPI